MPQHTTEIAKSHTSSTLNLRWNNLYQKTAAELVTMIQALPKPLTQLNLAWSRLCKKTGTELVAIMQALPKSLTQLDLSDNELNHKTGTELIAMMKALPASLTQLDLSWNDLSQKTSTEQVAIFSALAPSIEINIKNNGFTNAQIKTIEEVRLLAKTHHLQKITTSLTQKKDYLFEPIEPSFLVSESQLGIYITALEKENTGTSLLTCAFLLDGTIESEAMLDDKNDADLETYSSKRTHDAISFYIDAVSKDKRLKSLIEMRLWHLKVTTPVESIKQRLSSLNLQPQEQYLDSDLAMLSEPSTTKTPIFSGLKRFGHFASTSTELNTKSPAVNTATDYNGADLCLVAGAGYGSGV